MIIQLHAVQQQEEEAEAPPECMEAERPRTQQARRTRSKESASTRAFHAQQLMQPEWLTDIPSGLASSW